MGPRLVWRGKQACGHCETVAGFGSPPSHTSTVKVVDKSWHMANGCKILHTLKNHSIELHVLTRYLHCQTISINFNWYKTQNLSIQLYTVEVHPCPPTPTHLPPPPPRFRQRPLAGPLSSVQLEPFVNCCC